MSNGFEKRRRGSPQRWRQLRGKKGQKKGEGGGEEKKEEENAKFSFLHGMEFPQGERGKGGRFDTMIKRRKRRERGKAKEDLPSRLSTANYSLNWEEKERGKKVTRVAALLN